MWPINEEEVQGGRAVARSENPGGGHVLLGGDNVPPLVEIGLTDLPKTGGGPPAAPPPLPLATGLLTTFELKQVGSYSLFNFIPI